MLSIYLHILKKLALASGFLLSLSLALIFLGNRLSYAEATILICVFFPTINFFMAAALISGEFSLFLSYPFSRFKMILLVVAVNLSGALLSVSHLFINFTWNDYLLGELGKPSAPPNATDHPSLLSVLQNPDSISKFMVVIFVGILLLTFAWRSQAALTRPAVWSTPTNRKQLGFVFGLIFCMLFVPSFLLHFSIFLGFALFLFCLSLGTAASLNSSWLMPRRRAKKIAFSWMAFACVEIAILYAVAILGAASSKSERQLASLNFLGAMGPRADTQLLTELASHPINAEAAADYTELLSPKSVVGTRERWGKEQIKIPYRVLIDQQKDLVTLTHLTNLFAPEALSQEDLAALLKRIDSDNAVEPILPAPDIWLRTTLDDRFIIEMMQSKDITKSAFGFLYAEFHARPAFLPVGIKAIRSTVTQRNSHAALRSLSVLSGRAISFADLLRADPGLTFADFDCSKFKAKEARKEGEAKEGLFNRCQREKVLATKDGDLSPLYRWVTLRKPKTP